MSIRIQAADVHLIDLDTRLPFKYGIATMTRAPHAFVRVHVENGGRSAIGIAADHLPPKWFTKNPETPLDAEIAEMVSVIEHAVHAASGVSGPNAFEVWKGLAAEQDAWGRSRGMPPLLSNFGTTLVERAVVEAVCKLHKTSFAEAVRGDLLGVRLDAFDGRLAGCRPVDLLPPAPRQRVLARHTVGLADPITDSDIASGDRLDDGLPQSLADCIARYRLRHFKVKVTGDAESDIDRLRRVSCTVAQRAAQGYAFSLDGNEQFRSLDAFRDYWTRVEAEPALQPFLAHLMFVEQPFHRDVALDPQVLGGLSGWDNRPAMIIDESDAEPDSLPRALELGFHGTSHKNCKGVFRGIASACLLAKLRRERPEATYLMSGEDLANIGPVALLQDLAVAASLGVRSIERNGHHYFAGLSAFPSTVQTQVLQSHADLYHPSPAGWPTLTIQEGELAVASVNAAPLGVGFELDVEMFTSLDDWRN